MDLKVWVKVNLEVLVPEEVFNMITKYKIFELTMQQFARNFKKERDASVDKNIEEKPGKYYWKIKADDLDIIYASLEKLGAPKKIFNDIQLSKRRGLFGKNHFIEVWHNENFKSENQNTWLSYDWDWREWAHDKKLKGFEDQRYKFGYKYMGVVKITPEEMEFYTAMNKYNL